MDENDTAEKMNGFVSEEEKITHTCIQAADTDCVFISSTLFSFLLENKMKRKAQVWLRVPTITSVILKQV